MNDDELGRLLSGAFDAQARGAVGDESAPPAPRFALPVPVPANRADAASDVLPVRAGHRRESGSGSRLARAALPLSAAAAVVVLVGLVLVAGHGLFRSSPTHSAAAVGPTPVRSHSGSPSSSTPAAVRRVHVKLLNADGSIDGVGMPVIAYLSRKITDGRPLQRATTVTVDGKPMAAAWYVERSSAYPGYPYEAHLRPQNYWPAHAKIHVGIATDGLSAGTGMRFDDSLTLDFRTAASHIVTVDDKSHMLTVVSDGRQVASYPVSLGAKNTPTSRGTKVIMEKGSSICMSGPGYHECGIKYTQRLTYDGEYLHAAPWNIYNIRHGIDSSNGCTNLLTNDAKKLFGLLRVGDVVRFPNADGPRMQLGDGHGDWNVSWPHWLTGGLVRTH